MATEKKQISTWLDQELVDRLDERAEEEDRTRSKILERALIAYLETHDRAAAA